MTNEITIPKNLNEVDALIWLSKATSKAEALQRHLLWEVRDKRLWEGKYGTWRDFVVEGLDRTEGWASKQLKIYEFYELGGAFSAKELENVGMERLYLASRSTESPKEALARAQTWCREDFKDDKRDECLHTDPAIVVCRHCFKRM